MLRNVIRLFSQTLVVSSPSAEVLKHAKNRLAAGAYLTGLQCPCKFYTTTGSKVNPLESDEYILPYNAEDKPEGTTITSKEDLNDALRAKFRMRPAQIDKISTANLKLRRSQLLLVDKVLDILLDHGISKESVADNPWILTLTPRLLQTKLDILKWLNVRDINDVVPFLKLSAPRLLKVSSIMERESNEVPDGNRLYFISNQLKLEPRVVADYLSRRLFMLEMPFATLYENLHAMMRFGVPPISLLRDLWAFRYTPKCVESRLERAKNAKKVKIMPWMVRCPERIFLKSIKLSLDERKLLGENNTVVDYVSKRLGYDPETTKAIMSKHPATFKVRVTKIKEILDYLLDAEGYQPYEIAQTIRILCHGLETTKKRLEELKSYGCRPSSLIIVCRSLKEYTKFVRQWISMRNKTRQPDT